MVSRLCWVYIPPPHLQCARPGNRVLVSILPMKRKQSCQDLNCAIDIQLRAELLLFFRRVDPIWLMDELWEIYLIKEPIATHPKSGCFSGGWG